MKIRDRIKELRRVPAKQLCPSPKNWRTHPAAQRQALQGMLAEIGYADALLARELADGSLELIDGHLRAEVTPETDVPVLVLDVNEEEAAKLLATLDPLAALAGADPTKLEALMAEVSLESAAAMKMLEDLAAEARVSAERAVVEDEAPAPLLRAVTRPGDLWLLGDAGGCQHRLLCGDSTRLDDVLLVMNGEQAALVATDPPYLVDYTGERPKKGDRESGKDWSATYREVEIKDADHFFRSVFGNVLRVIAPRGAIYCWHAHRRCGLIQRIWEELGILDHQQIIWVKPASVFGRVYWHFRHEPCMMGWVKGSQPAHGASGREAHVFDSVWEIGWERGGAAGGIGVAETGAEPVCGDQELSGAGLPEGSGGSVGSVGSGGLHGGGKARPGDNEHPTQKPVEIFARPMRRHTRGALPSMKRRSVPSATVGAIGDVCFEPFSGSGSQLIAAEQLGRRCYAIELEPVFVDVAIRRWQMLTGREAVLAVPWSGSDQEAGESECGGGQLLTWAQVALERGVEVPENAAKRRSDAKVRAAKSGVRRNTKAKTKTSMPKASARTTPSGAPGPGAGSARRSKSRTSDNTSGKEARS
ncbi:MAG: DNA methyltransferase [Phycisphaerales bacterium]